MLELAAGLKACITTLCSVTTKFNVDAANEGKRLQRGYKVLKVPYVLHPVVHERMRYEWYYFPPIFIKF